MKEVVSPKKNYLKEELYELVQSDPVIFDFLQAGSLDGIWYWDLEKPENEWMSPRFWETFGFDPKKKKHLASEWQDLIFQDDLKVAISNFQAHCKDASHPYDQLVRYRHKDGSTVWVRCRGVAIRDEKGKPIRMLGAHTNITSLKETESELRKFEKAVRNAVNPIVMVDGQQTITYTNPSFLDLTGYSEAELLGQSGNTFIHESTPSEIMTQMREALEKGNDFFSEDLLVKGADQSAIPVSLSVYPVKTEGEIELFVGILEDISERKAVEKMKSEFISIASHQLRTPLTSIQLFADILRKDESITGSQKEHIGYILESANRMSELIHDLLDLSRLETGRIPVAPVRRSLERFISRTVSEFRILAEEKGIALSFENKLGNSPVVKIDETLLRQVLGNLLSNAIKYTHEDGAIKVSLAEKDEWYRIHVKDNGIGITEKAKPRIFDRFFRSDEAMELDVNGSGLGLYLVKLIMEETGGKITFTSTPGKGTEFILHLPKAGMAPTDA